ncbi:hypothetical protein ACMD2_25755 [Ananas comosus]|uniref:Uncharacterized protein n=1 Tax=Ananas comosus TaxID=4615 RepID=A0A199UXB2_ANACO|nr:hypothetical protein ACMD2_25755 [Ananas comosus]
MFAGNIPAELGQLENLQIPPSACPDPPYVFNI